MTTTDEIISNRVFKRVFLLTTSSGRHGLPAVRLPQEEVRVHEVRVRDGVPQLLGADVDGRVARQRQREEARLREREVRVGLALGARRRRRDLQRLVDRGASRRGGRADPEQNSTKPASSSASKVASASHSFSTCASSAQTPPS